MNTKDVKDSSINIRRDILQNIHGIAEKQHLTSESLINHILEQYIRNALLPPQPSQDAAFLLSMAGMFHSEKQHTSEHVHEIVSTYVETKHATQSDS